MRIKRFKIYKNSLSVQTIALYVILFFACLDTITRLSINDDISIFRILSVFVLAYGAIYKWNKLKKAYLFMAAVLVYSLLMNFLWKGKIEAVINNYIHWLFVFSLYVCVYLLSEKKEFVNSFFKFLDFVTTLTLIVFFVEYFSGIHFFAKYITYYDLPSAFYYGINDCASALIVVGVLYILKFIDEKNYMYLLKFALILLTVTLLGSRASMLVLALALMLGVFIKVFSMIHDKTIKIMLFIVIPSVVALLVFIINPKVGDVTITELIIAPIKQILNLEISDYQESITIRATAIVIGLKELFSTFGFGIGVGNCTVLLSSYGFSALKSMHNMLMQIITEMGWFAIISLFFVIKYTINSFKKREENKQYHIYGVVMLLIAPLIGLQSSEGLLSIYIVWITLFYVFIAMSKDERKLKPSQIKEEQLTQTL